MFDQSVFPSILGLSSQWQIRDVTLTRKQNRLEITVAADPGAPFDCPICKGQAITVSEQETHWQHENLFNLRARITAVLPMTSCKICGINRVLAPWEKPESRFVLLMQEDDAE